MINKNKFQQPMEPWPALKSYGKKIKLSQSDIELFIFETGKDNHPNILMIHGLGDEADTWRHVIEPLAEKYHVVALDLPGFGRSCKPKRRYTPEFMIQSILDLMDDLEIEKAILMGSSLGAILTHKLAISNPERVFSMILVGGALYQPQPMQDKGLRLMQIPLLGEWLYTRLRKDPDAAFDSLKAVYHNLDYLPKADQDFLYQRVNQRVWSDGQRRAYFSTLRHLIPWVKKLQKKLPNQLPGIQSPTLVIRGEYDPLFPQENAQAVIEKQPNAQIAIINNVNHLPQQEDPQSFLNAVNNCREKN